MKIYRNTKKILKIISNQPYNYVPYGKVLKSIKRPDCLTHEDRQQKSWIYQWKVNCYQTFRDAGYLDKDFLKITEYISSTLSL